MPELVPWGYGGVQLAQEHQMNDQVMQMRDLAMDVTQTDLNAKQADAAIQQDAAKYMQQIAKGQSPAMSGGTNPTEVSSYSEAFRKTAQHLFEMGAPKQAQDYLKSANELDKGEIANTKSQLDTKKTQGEILIQQSDIMARDLGEATSQDEWNQGVQAMKDSGLFTPKQIQQFENIPFHPAAAKVIRERALSVKDKANLDMQAQQERRIQFNADRSASIQMQRLAFDKYKEEQRQREVATNNKTGAIASAPNKDEIKAAEASVSNLIFNGKLPSELEDGEESPSYKAYQAGVQQIAADAKQMVRENKGLSWQTALNRATMLSKTQGDWDIQTQSHLLDDDTVSATFNGLGKRPEDAIPMPMNQDNKPDPSKLKKGRWYISPANGKKGKWNGTSFDVMQ